MDFDKIKKVAKETFKVVSNKANEVTPPPRAPREPEDDFDDFSMVDDLMGQTRKFDMKDALNRVKKNTESIKNSVAELINDDDTDVPETKKYDKKALNSDLNDISEEVKALRQSNENLEGHIVAIERKLSEISNAVSGVNKINDSIFDLKNSQINTRNSINELEVSFRKMKKKMISGITVISIITAIVAVLEIINLLS